MRRLAIAIAMLTAVVTACGDDATTSTTAVVTTAVTTTTAAATTTSAVTTTVADAGAERAAALAAIAGTYTGAWNNTTFGSTGPIAASLDVDVEARFAVLSLDLGGFVFGGPDPDPLVVEFDLLVAGPYPGSNALFGEFTMDLVDGHLTMIAPAVPGVGGREMVLEGDLAGDSFAGTYTIDGLADGTFIAQRG